MLSVLSLAVADWNFNPLDYGPLAGVIVVVLVFLNKIGVLVEYIKFRDQELREMNHEMSKVISNVTLSIQKLTSSLDENRQTSQILFGDTMRKELNMHFSDEQKDHNEIKKSIESLENKLVRLTD